MRIAVAGGTGLVGGRVCGALRAGGHEVVILARGAGVDLVSGDGVDEAVAGVEAVVDVTNTPATEAEQAVRFFGTVTANLLAAEQRAGVGHHVLLSIVGVDRVAGNGHYEGKRRQEQLVENGPVSWTIQRATQFFEFPAMVAGWTTRDGVSIVPPLLIQPVAVADLATVLAELAAGEPQRRAVDLAGPETHDFVDMARRTLAARGESVRLRASWRDGPFGVEMAGEVLLPDDSCRLGSTTFDAWLEAGAGS